MEEKKGMSPVLIVILSVLAICLIAFGVWFGIRYVNKVEKTQPGEPEEVSTIVEDEPTTNTSYVGEYEAKATLEFEGEIVDEGVYQLILRSDNTFVYNNSVVAYSPLVGTYTVEGTNLVLKGIVSYGSDACYFTKGEDIRTVKGTIKDGDVITITDNGETYDYKKNSTFVETNWSKEYYVTNPVNGTGVGDEEWLYCEND